MEVNFNEEPAYLLDHVDWYDGTSEPKRVELLWVDKGKPLVNFTRDADGDVEFTVSSVTGEPKLTGEAKVYLGKRKLEELANTHAVPFPTRNR